jgi:putative tricarboxylic transport membrane protein
LTTDYEVIVVAKDSEVATMQDLATAMRRDLESVSIAGGSAGGVEHILAGLVARAVGEDPAKANYVAHSGGGDAVNAILADPNLIGVSGVSEFADQVEAGEMRWLAVSGEEPPEGIDAPTITEAGYDVVLENWRGVMGAPDLSDEDREAVVSFITEMHDSEGWQAALEEHGWTDLFLAGDEYAAFLDEEKTRVEGVLAELGLTGG